MKKRCLGGMLATTLLIGQSAIAAPNPTPGGVLWGRDNGNGSQGGVLHDLAYWNHPTNAGAVNGYSVAPVRPSGMGNTRYAGFGKFGNSQYGYIVRKLTGNGEIYRVNALTPTVYTQIGNVADQNWTIGGMADFDKDGIDDLAWRNNVTGDQQLWFLNANNTIKGSTIIQSLAGGWSMRGAGDFNNDTNMDLVFHNNTTGEVYTWHLNAAYQLNNNFQLITTLPNATWDVKDASDFDGDGDADILAHNKTTGVARVYRMQAGAIAGTYDLVSQTPANNGTTPTYTYTSQIFVDAPVGSVNMASFGGNNEKALGDLGALPASVSISSPSLFLHDSSASFDNRYKFSVSSTQNLAVGVTNPCLRLNVTNATGQSTGTSSPAGGVVTASFPAGTHYLRVQAAGSACAINNSLLDNRVVVNAAAPSPTLISDIAPGNKGGNVISTLPVGSTTYFMTSDGPQAGLWKTDGTTATFLKAGRGAKGFASIGTTVYFSMFGDGTGMELWKSDGTAAGTVRVRDINPNGDSNPSNFRVFNSKVYFAANDGTNGIELWQSDGTSAGTTMVANIHDGAHSSNPEWLTLFNNRLVFAATQMIYGRELFSVDAANTVTRLTDATQDHNPRNLTVVGSELYYSGASAGQEVGLDKDIELYSLSTSWLSTKLDINPGTPSSDPNNLFAWGSTLLFSATNQNGNELHKRSGGVTTQVADIFTGATAGVQNSSNPNGFAIVGSNVVFAATDAANGRELWSYNNSAAPTRISQIAAGTASSDPNGMRTTPNGTFFSATNNTSGNYELWSTNGTTVTQVAEVNTSTVRGSFPSLFTQAGTKTLFNAYTDENGFEPRYTTGTAASTVLAADTFSDPNAGFSPGVTTGGWTYFAATDAAIGRELRRTNGTTTQTVVDAEAGQGSSNPSNIVIANGIVYWIAETSANGRKLWRYDGTTASIAANLNGVNVSDGLSQIAATTDNNVYVVGMKADGTTSVNRLNAGAFTEVKNLGNTGEVANFTAVGTSVYMSADDRSGSSFTGHEPWVLTSTGMTQIANLNAGDKSSLPYGFTRIDNGDVGFAAKTDATGYEFYRLPAGTNTPALVKDINPGAGGSNIASIQAMGNEWFFAAYNGGILSIYRSNGTAAGTNPDIYFNQDTQLSPIGGYTGKTGLEYKDYTQLLPVASGPNKSIYTVSLYGKREALTTDPGTGFCNFITSSIEGREVNVSFPVGVNPHNTASRPVSGGTSPFSPGNGFDLATAQSAISVSYPAACLTTASEQFHAPHYDDRLSRYEDVILGSANGTIYIAGWKGSTYEVWSMAHSESFTARYASHGGVAPRNLNFVGTISAQRGTFAFQPAGTSMFVQGFDATSKTYKQWKLN